MIQGGEPQGVQWYIKANQRRSIAILIPYIRLPPKPKGRPTMAELPLLLIDIAATLIECLLRLMFWIGRKCGWIKPSAPKPTRMQTRLLGGALLLLLLGLALWR